VLLQRSDIITPMKRFIFGLIQRFLGSLGFQVVEKNKDILVNTEFGDTYEKCKEFTMTSKERMYALYKSVEYIIKADIPGDFVECGVWKGGSSMVIACSLLKLGVKDRKIYLYDTYEGMSEPTDKDKDLVTNKSIFKVWRELRKNSHSDWCYASVEEVKDNMKQTKYPNSQIIFVKGKVENTIPINMPSRISLLRLDTDWYESTKHALEHLYPLLSERGVLLLDDYGCWEGAKKAVDEYFADLPPLLLNRIDYTGRVAIKI